jgi:hypothetical protein
MADVLIVMPTLAPSLTVSVPFALSIFSYDPNLPSLKRVVVIGSGEATATFTSDEQSWHLQDITYSVTKHVFVDLP